MEADWGLQTLEIPLSSVCQTEPFCWFVAHLLAQLPRFRQVYNEAVREYRRLHRIRNRAHPAAELSSQGRRLEAPLWVFTDDDPRRRVLTAECHTDRIVLSDGQRLRINLPLSADGDAARAVERLMELPGQGVRIRSRALITTLWARLALGHLFVHGVGGAKYDQLTDVLIRRFFGVVPPRFAVVSATLHLPVRRPEVLGEVVSVEQLRAIRRQLRELDHHPEQFIDQADANMVGVSNNPTDLAAAKSAWIRTASTPQNARTRCRAIRQINRSLQPWVEARRRRLQESEVEAVRTLRAAEVLCSREYGFCLFPEKTFRNLLRVLLPKTG